MGMFSIGGLATGLDTRSIIEKLMMIESRPRVKLEWQRELWSARKNAWSDLNTRLLSLGNFAGAILNTDIWNAPPMGGVTSSDPTKVTGSIVGSSPAVGTYGIEVQQLATSEIWTSTGALASPTSGTRTTGTWWRGTNSPMLATTRLTALRNDAGQSVGIGIGSTFHMSWEVDGVTYNADFAIVTGDERFNDLRAWMETTIGNGATVAINNGKLEVTTAPGTQNELTKLTFSATNSSGDVHTRWTSANAQATQSSTLVAASDGGVLADETMYFDMGGTIWSVDVFAGDQISDIAQRINGAGIGVQAAVVNGQLEIRSRSTGANQAFTISSSGSVAADLAFTRTQAARDAQFTVNGASYTSAVNTAITGVIGDVALDLLAITNTEITLTVKEGDKEAQDEWVSKTRKKVLDFVNQYNSVLEFIASKVNEQKALNPKNLSEYLQGPVARDLRFSSVAFDLRRALSDAVQLADGTSALLSDIGINSSYEVGSKGYGRLTLDEAKLEQALRDDPDRVRAILTQVGTGDGVTPDDGFMRRASELVSLLRVGGKVDTALQGAGSQVTRLQDSIDLMNVRLGQRRTYYERMFASLETTIGRMRVQSDWLSARFAQLSGQTRLY